MIQLKSAREIETMAAGGRILAATHAHVKPAIVPGINALMDEFRAVILTQDWHPARHSSFATSHWGREPYEEVEMS